MTKPILLVFPPHCESALQGPHLAIPQLAAFLRQAGQPVRTRDLNIGFFRHFTRPDTLGPLIDDLEKRRDKLARAEILSRAEMDELLDLATLEILKTHLQNYASDDLLDDEDFFIAKRLLNRRIYEGPHSFEAILSVVHSPGPSMVARYFDEIDLEAMIDGVGLVGISVAFHLQLYPALELAARIKRLTGHHIPLVIGGSQIGLMTDAQKCSISQLKYVDALIVHEGEVPLVELCAQLRNGGKPDFEKVPNSYYDSDGKVQHPVWHKPPAMSALPCPEFNGDELSMYLAPRILPVYVSKGCYWGRCKFCDYTKLYTPGQAKGLAWATFRPTGKLVDDIKLLRKRYGTTVFYLVSEAISPSYYTRLAKEILKQRIDVRLSSYCRVEKTFTADFFSLLHKAGVRSLTFGAEATEDRILALIDKGNTVSDIRKTIRLAHASGIHVKFNLIPDYPTITWQEVQNMLSFITDNIDFIDEINPQFFDLSSNSIILQEQEQHGIHSIAFERKTGLTPVQLQSTRDAFQVLEGELKSHRRIRDLLNLVSMPKFDWQRASFVLTANLESIELFFNPLEPKRSDGRNIFPRLSEPVLVLSDTRSRRRLVCRPVVAAILETSAKLSVFTIGDVLQLMPELNEFSDKSSTIDLLQRCLVVMLRNGMIADIMHPWFDIKESLKKKE